MGVAGLLWERVYGGRICHLWEKCTPVGFKGGWKTMCGLHMPMAHHHSGNVKKCPKCLEELAARATKGE